MVRPDSGIVEAGRDRKRVGDLAVVVLQQVGAVAVQHARPPAGERGRVLSARNAVAGRLDADDAHALVVEEGMEQADGAGAAADAGDEGVGPAPFGRHDLLARFAADDRLRSEEDTYELQSPMGISYAVFWL